jgi:hypothetical protein
MLKQDDSYSIYVATIMLYGVVFILTGIFNLLLINAYIRYDKLYLPETSFNNRYAFCRI